MIFSSEKHATLRKDICLFILLFVFVIERKEN